MIEQWLSSEWLYGGVSFHPGRVEIGGVGIITPATTDADHGHAGGRQAVEV